MKTTTLPTKKTLLAAAAALALALVGAACSAEGGADEPSTAEADGSAARLATAEFDVDGMTCGGCALATEMAVKKLDGVASAEAAYDEETDEGRCTVEYDPDRVTTDRIAAAIEEAGFSPSLASGPSTSPDPPAERDGS